MITGSPKEGMVQIGKGVTSNAVGRFITHKNDPNTLIRKIFEKPSKNKVLLPKIVEGGKNLKNSNDTVGGVKYLKNRGARTPSVSWKEGLELFREGKLPTNNTLEVYKPKGVLKELFGDNPLTISQSRLRIKMDKHGLNFNDIKHLDSGINNHILAYQTGGKHPVVVVVTPLQKGKERIAVAINHNPKTNLPEIAEIKSIHPKDGQRLVKELFDGKIDNLYSANNKKISSWLGSVLPNGGQPTTKGGDLNSILHKFGEKANKNPKIANNSPIEDTKKLQSWKELSSSQRGAVSTQDGSNNIIPKTPKIANNSPKSYTNRHLDATTITQEQAKNMAQKYFKNDTVGIKLANRILTQDGGEAFGMYYKKMITFAKNPTKFTPEHEVLHAYMDIAMTKQQKNTILKAMQKEQNLKTKLDAEEWLADTFAEFVVGRREAKTMSAKMRKIMDDLMYIFKKFFGQEDKVQGLMRELESIGKGKASMKVVGGGNGKNSKKYLIKNQPAYHTSSKEIKALNNDKILWLTQDLEYSKNYGKNGQRITYSADYKNLEDLNILDGYSQEGIKILQSMNKKLPKNKQFSEILNKDGGVSAFFIQDKKVIELLRQKGVDAVEVSEFYNKSVKSIGVINPERLNGKIQKLDNTNTKESKKLLDSDSVVANSGAKFLKKSPPLKPSTSLPDKISKQIDTIENSIRTEAKKYPSLEHFANSAQKNGALGKLFMEYQSALGKRHQQSVLKQLQKIYNDHKDFIDNFHKNTDLQFRVMSVQDFNNLGKNSLPKQTALDIYKSPVYNNKQSSAYKLGIIDGKIAYIRKSNHWGGFKTNIKAGTEEARELAMQEGKPKNYYDIGQPGYMNDDAYGRVGQKWHNWELIGGKLNAKNSQAGYILLEDLPSIDTKTPKTKSIEDFWSERNEGVVMASNGAKLLAKNNASKKFDEGFRRISERQFKKLQEAIKENTSYNIRYNPNKKVEALLKDSGYEGTIKSHIISSYGIRHILKRHGPNSGDKNPITMDDIRNIPEIITNPDNIKLSNKNSKGGEIVIIYEKQIGNTYFYLEGLDNHGNLKTKTMYKKDLTNNR